MKIVEYNAEKAVEYAQKWALGRNPRYYNYEYIGGDCSNFVSQCIYAGSNVMNFYNYGWFYISANKHSASWTDVRYLHQFLVTNKGIGPFAEEVDISMIRPGDVIQLAFQDETYFQHSALVISIGDPITEDNIMVAAHTYDVYNKPLSEYMYIKARYIHIKGVRK